MPLSTMLESYGNAALGGLMGMAFGQYADNRQYEQQKRLQALQLEGSKDLTDYSYNKQMQMWRDTNYSAQKDEIKKAGLNPALLYGMKGGGGTTIGAGASSVGGGQASRGDEPTRMSGMAMQANIQTQLMEAQKENIEADTKLKNATATKTAGVDTEVSGQQANVLAQQYENLRQDHTVKLLEITMKNIENYIKVETKEDVIAEIKAEAKQAINLAALTGNEKKVSDATVQEQIQIVQQKAIAGVLQNMLTQAQTDQTKQQTILTADQSRKIVNEIMLNWDKLENDKKETFIKQKLMEFNTDMPTQLLLRGVSAISGIVGSAMKKGATIHNYDPTTIIQK